MNACNRTIRFTALHSLSRAAVWLLGGLLVLPCLAQPASVTVTLGQSNEDLTLNGLGANSSGLGTYQITLGNCAQSGSNTVCTITGTYTSTSSVLGSGTYTVTTTLANTTTAQVPGVEQAAGSNYFTFGAFPAETTITLTLVSANGTFVEPLIEYNQFVTGASLYFFYASPTCSGTSVASCSVSSIGTTSGSSITGLVTGTATFNLDYTYYFSQFAVSFGYQTTMTYINYSPQTVTCVTNFYADSGAALSVPFSSGAVSSRTDTLAAGQSIHAQTTGVLNAALSQGWAEATCDGPIKGSLLYRLYNSSGVATGEASVLAETAPTTEFATFAQTATGIAYGNPSTTQTGTVTVAVFNQAGTKLASKEIVLGPLQHGAANLGPLLGLQSFEGFVEITSNIPIISLSLNAEAFPVFSSLPPGDLPATTPLVN